MGADYTAAIRVKSAKISMRPESSTAIAHIVRVSLLEKHRLPRGQDRLHSLSSKAKFNNELPEHSSSSFLPRGSGRASAVISGALVILALVFVAYRPILPGSFLMDDWRMVNA